MKLFRYKIPHGSGILFLSFLLVSFSCLMTASNLRDKIVNETLSRAYHSEHGKRAIMNEGISPEDFGNRLQSNQNGRYLLMKEGIESIGDTRGVFYQGRIKDPPIKSGRWFTTADFWKGERIALVGEYYLQDAVERNGKQYVEILGEWFEVIGVLGVAQTSRFDTIQMIPLDTALELTGTVGNYFVDAPNAQEVKNAFAMMEGYVEELVTYRNGSIKLDSSHPLSSMLYERSRWEAFFADKPTLVYYVIFFTFILTAIFTSSYWITYKRQKTQVQRMLGLARFEIVRSILKEYLCITLLSNTVSIIVCVILYTSHVLQTFQLIDILFTFILVTLVGGLFITGFLFRQLRRENIELSRL